MQPRTSGRKPTRGQPGDRFGVGGVRAGQIAGRPAGEPGERAGRRAGQRVVGRGERERFVRACATVPSRSAVRERQRGPVHLRSAPAPIGSCRRRSRSRPAVAAPARRRPANADWLRSGRAARRSGAKSPTCASAPTNAMPRTGRARTTSSGSARTQRASSASRRSRWISGMASSMRSAARPVSPPASAWLIACEVSPAASNHTLARRCSSGTWSGRSSIRWACRTSANRWW